MPSVRKTWRWYYKFPHSVYANGPTERCYPSERAVRTALRAMLECGSELPRGFEVWKTND